jgi:hypothetical protein
MKPGIFITFDVECSMGGAWANASLRPVPPRLGMMGQYRNKSYGLPLICEILARHDLKATFFVEPFNDELGYPGQTEPVCRFLIDQGQDVQLHVHPNHVHYGLHLDGKPHAQTDYMANLPPDWQREMLIEGAERILRWTGKSPIAFRAGNMGASEQTLSIMPDAGLWIDSSYSFPFLEGQCRFKDKAAYNGAKWYGDVLEMALSGFFQRPIPKILPPSQPVDLMGGAFAECRDAVGMICDAGADAVLILHSFSLFKVKDVQYRAGRPNWVVTRRFDRFCQWMANNRERYPVRTFSELGKMVKENGYQPKAVGPCRLNKPLRALTRKVVQGLNNFYWF